MVILKTDFDLNRRQQSKQRHENLSENETAGETHLDGQGDSGSQSNASLSLSNLWNVGCSRCVDQTNLTEFAHQRPLVKTHVGTWPGNSDKG